MKYSQAHTAFVAIIDKLKNDGLLKDSYVNILAAVESKLKMLAAAEGTK